jgi:cytochrome b subunit of formate dehydrogenase
MLRYPEAWWVQGIRSLSSNAFELRSLGHRVAGVVMLVLAAWHVGYLLFTVPGRSLLRDLLPKRRDLTDPWKVLRYNLGLSKERVLFLRFSYIEKMEYWAMVWGTFLMGATGIILWFDNVSMGYITKLGFDISRTVHFYEAILATLAIIIWHFYWVIYNPSVYPMNLAWLTGRMSEQEMEEEHPLQLKEMKAEEVRKKGEETQPSQPPDTDPAESDGPR